MIEEKRVEFNLSKFGGKSKSIHWVNTLLEYKKHPLKNVLLEFSEDIGSFLLSSYVYFGMTTVIKGPSKHDIRVRRNVTVVHYHSELDGPYLFSEMQNLKSYEKIPSLAKFEIPVLSQLVTKESVNLMACNNALSKKNLEYILACRNIILCDEKGNGRDFR